MKQIRTKGMLWWKYRWVSFCSAHRYYNKDCRLCQSGYWYKDWEYKIDIFLQVLLKKWDSK